MMFTDVGGTSLTVWQATCATLYHKLECCSSMNSLECDVHWTLTAFSWISSSTGPPCHVDFGRSTRIAFLINSGVRHRILQKK